jgi:hypothetical protein
MNPEALTGKMYRDCTALFLRLSPLHHFEMVDKYPIRPFNWYYQEQLSENGSHQALSQNTAVGKTKIDFAKELT